MSGTGLGFTVAFGNSISMDDSVVGSITGMVSFNNSPRASHRKRLDPFGELFIRTYIDNLNR